MKTVKIGDVLNNEGIKAEFLETLRKGGIVIYPTDTVYGIGCLVEKEEAVKKISEVKGRDQQKPFSMIIPSVEWVKENCSISDFNLDLLKQLFPGPYTAVLRVKKDSGVPAYIMSKEHTVGIRIPKNKITDIIRGAGLLVVSTSVNLSGKGPVAKLGDVPETIKNITSIAIDAGELKGASSRVFDLTTDNVRIIRA